MWLFHRRSFLGACVSGVASGLRCADLRADERNVRRAPHALGFNAPRIRITDIERHEVLLPFHDFNALSLFRYHGLAVQLRTVYVVKTDAGLEGLGESWGRGPAREGLLQYVGSSPFDWLGADIPLSMSMAVYDLMGKSLGLPAWKLLGPKVRGWVPVAAWAVSLTPAEMAEEVRQAVRRGYRWLKYHVGETQNVVDQTAAMQKVAPRGFRVHYDFNANATYAAVLPVLQELERFPIAGRIEDPLAIADRRDWRLLREKCRLPFLAHHAPAEYALEKVCDGLIVSHAPVGSAAKLAGAAETLNVPVLLQQCGGTINRAFLAHEAAVFKSATMEAVDLCDLWKDDVTIERIPVVSGSMAVPAGPGLGVTLDRKKLEKYAHAPRPAYQPFLVRTRYADGLTVYCRHNADRPGAADNMRYIHRLHGENAPGPPPGYSNPLVSDFWSEPGTAEYDDLSKRTEKGPVWTRSAQS